MKLLRLLLSACCGLTLSACAGGGAGGSRAVPAAAQPPGEASAQTAVAQAANVPPPSAFKFFPVSFQPGFIAAGADGNLWFTGSGVAKVGRLTPAGSESDYTISSAAKTELIAAGPDGVWFTEPLAGSIGRITASGALKEFHVVPGPYSLLTFYQIAAGSDGAVWFSEPERRSLGRLTPSGAYSEVPLPPVAALANAPAGPLGVSPGPAGVIWFTAVAGSAQPAGNVLGEIDAADKVTYHVIPEPASLTVSLLTRASDDSLWMYSTGTQTLPSAVGHYEAGLPIRTFDVPGKTDEAYGLAAAGATAWFTQLTSGTVLSINSAGHFTSYTIPIHPLLLTGLTATPDGALWFAAQTQTAPHYFIVRFKPD
jgi:virginiamycin B lyase